MPLGGGGPLVDALPFRLLRAHVSRGAEYHADLRTLPRQGPAIEKAPTIIEREIWPESKNPLVYVR